MTEEEIQLVAEARRMADEEGAETYSDEQVLALVRAAGSAAAAAARIWQTKAGRYSTLVNTSESGSSRSNGDLYKNALAMAKYYDGIANPVVNPETVVTTPFTAEITRP